MPKEYIEREAALEIINSLNIASALYAGRKIINLPPADVSPVRHGLWIEHKHYHHAHYIDSTYECSECKVEESLTSDYCPNCGARMDGDWNA